MCVGGGSFQSRFRTDRLRPAGELQIAGAVFELEERAGLTMDTFCAGESVFVYVPARVPLHNLGGPRGEGAKRYGAGVCVCDQTA